MATIYILLRAFGRIALAGRETPMLIQLVIQHPQMLAPIVKNTPPWVWSLLAALLAMGLSDDTRTIRRDSRIRSHHRRVPELISNQPQVANMTTTAHVNNPIERLVQREREALQKGRIGADPW